MGWVPTYFSQTHRLIPQRALHAHTLHIVKMIFIDITRILYTMQKRVIFLSRVKRTHCDWYHTLDTHLPNGTKRVSSGPHRCIPLLVESP